MINQEAITEAICEELTHWEFDHTPREINGGMCGEFAHRVQKHFGGIARRENDLRVVGCEIDGYDVLHDKWGGHQWLYDPVDDRHYDAECPEGVDDWKELPFFNR